jgi:hypothetical protein
MVGAGSMVHGCVIGDDTVVAPGTRLFNLVRAEERRPPSALRLSLRRRVPAAVSLAGRQRQVFSRSRVFDSVLKVVANI